MIARRKPFGADDPENLAAAIEGFAPPPISELRVGVPANLARVIDRCLQAEPAARWQTAEELATELRSIASAQRPRKRLTSIAGVAAAAVLLATGAIYWWNAPSIIFIAVLPFRNATPMPDTEYLTDGITEGIINSLSSAPGLKVIARDTAFTFKDQEVDLQAVGRRIGCAGLIDR